MTIRAGTRVRVVNTRSRFFGESGTVVAVLTDGPLPYLVEIEDYGDMPVNFNRSELVYTS